MKQLSEIIKAALGGDKKQQRRASRLLVETWGQIKAAHGEATGKPTMMALQGKLSKAVQDDPRFAVAQVPSGGWQPRSYVTDVLVPDDDGSMECVVCMPGKSDPGNYIPDKCYRVGFEWDGDDVTLSDEDATETEATVVYCAEAERQDAIVRATWSDAAREAAAEARKGKAEKDDEVNRVDEKMQEHHEEEESQRRKDFDGAKPEDRRAMLTSKLAHSESANAFATGSKLDHKFAADMHRNAARGFVEKSGEEGLARMHLHHASIHEALSHDEKTKMSLHATDSAAEPGVVTAAWSDEARAAALDARREGAKNVRSIPEDDAKSAMHLAPGQEMRHGDVSVSRREDDLTNDEDPSQSQWYDVKHGDKSYAVHQQDLEWRGKGNLDPHGMEKTYGEAEGSKAKELGEKAKKLTNKVYDSDTKAGHMKAANAHEAAANAHAAASAHFYAAGEIDKRSEYEAARDQHAKMAERHIMMHNGKASVQSSNLEPEQAAVIRASDRVVHCRESGIAISSKDKRWEQGVPIVFQYMPGGVSTITAGYEDMAINLTVDVDEDTAGIVQASFDEMREKMPRQEPFGCVEHREEEAALHPDAFSWKDDPEPGVYCAARPTDLGARNVNGRIHRSWSPSFTTDADYARAKERNGVMNFPDGVRGSRSNPARITGVAFSIGSLTNKPAFKNILPVKAKEAGTGRGGAPQPETEAEQLKGLKMKVKFVKARGSNAAGTYGELTGSDLVVALESGDVQDAVTAKRMEDVEAEQAAVKASNRKAAEAKVDAAVDAAVGRGVYHPQGDKANCAPTVKASMRLKLDRGMDAEDLVEMIENKAPDKAIKAAIVGARQTRQLQDDGTERQVASFDAEFGDISLRETVKAAIKACEPMQKALRNGGIVRACGVGSESARANLIEARELTLKRDMLFADIAGKVRCGGDFRMSDVEAIIKAADYADPASANPLGVLNTGLLLQWNLGFLANQLALLSDVTTDVSGQPVLFNQVVRTRYQVVPKLMLKTNSNAWPTTGAPTGTDVDVNITMATHAGVPLSIGNAVLASTARQLFNEQRAPQLYSLGEYIIFKLIYTALNGSTRIANDGTSTATQKFNPANLPGGGTGFNVAGATLKTFVADLPAAMDLAKFPGGDEDPGDANLQRFAWVHTSLYSTAAQDTNFLLNQSIWGAVAKSGENLLETGRFARLGNVKFRKSQLMTDTVAATGTGADSTTNGITVSPGTYTNATTIGLAGTRSSLLFVSRTPLDYTKVLPDVPSTAAIEMVTEPKTGLTFLVVKHLDHAYETANMRAQLMFDTAVGDERQGLYLNQK